VGRAGTGVRLINVAYGLHHDGKPIGYNSSSNWIAPRIHHKLTVSEYRDAVKGDRIEPHIRGFESGEPYIALPTTEEPLFSYRLRAA
jgi:hypothetical protein